MMIAATTLIFSGLVWKLVHGFDRLDDVLNASTPLDRVERKGGIFR